MISYFTKSSSAASSVYRAFKLLGRKRTTYRAPPIQSNAAMTRPKIMKTKKPLAKEVDGVAIVLSGVEEASPDFPVATGEVIVAV